VELSYARGSVKEAAEELGVVPGQISKPTRVNPKSK
jgi:hypothetical protein